MANDKTRTDTGGQSASTIDLRRIAERGKSLELKGAFTPPPGDPVSHFGAGFAKVMASNVYLAGLPLEFAAEHVGYFTAPYEDRKHVVSMAADDNRREVKVQLDNGVTRTAQILGSQGAVATPLGGDNVFFEPREVIPAPRDQKQCLWPDEVQAPRSEDLREVLDLAFEPQSMTTAFVVTHKGRIIAERYRPGIEMNTPLESWSMGKSLTATMLGRLMHDGEYDLWQPAPIPEWQSSADTRASIRIADIMRMSSGLRFRAMQDPDYKPSTGYPDHLYVYTGGVDAFRFCAGLEQQWPADTVGRYRNCDPVLANYLIRLAVEARGDDYHSFPQRDLFDRLGIETMVLETDPYGNFLTQGYEFGSARDWARLGNLYLNDGIWDDERLLPEGWCDFVATRAPAWVADGRPIYGGFFWINGDGSLPIPKDTYFMAGAGLQRTFIIPSHDLCVVRLGHYSGMTNGTASLKRALAKLMAIID
jgi:CubicO group peptidase (beta-lactamase class C family)